MAKPSLMLRYHARLARNYLRWRLEGKPHAEKSVLHFRASALDCDWFGHINNARYLEFFDAGRTDLFVRMGLFEHANAHGWTAVVGTMNVRYRREVRMGKRFTLETSIDRIEGKTVVFVQKIFLGETLATEAECHVVVVKNRKAVDAGFLAPLVLGKKGNAKAAA